MKTKFPVERKLATLIQTNPTLVVSAKIRRPNPSYPASPVYVHILRGEITDEGGVTPPAEISIYESELPALINALKKIQNHIKHVNAYEEEL